MNRFFPEIKYAVALLPEINELSTSRLKFIIPRPHQLSSSLQSAKLKASSNLWLDEVQYRFLQSESTLGRKVNIRQKFERNWVLLRLASLLSSFQTRTIISRTQRSHECLPTTTMHDPNAYEQRAKYTRFRILVIGRANAGKTTLLQRVCNTTDDPCIYDDDEKNLVSVHRPEDDCF